ncbi:hypothetical protein G5B19_18640 [Enterocloster clostridioformis]|uniref:Uncharacterized protein n=1 Tax=Enterocloster clostridioformis TaxID=1531 RepID=A0AAP9M4L8_9FIRM|nr:hypothetical protein [Enterocloster clostridioformis]NSD57770.1 hypothetical protein [Enterocloster clostridioformis]NSJ11782.1 hypothetical protein [Enterocloster clostridioformis]NSJ20641.1 hypothetical protein [Enterocloster clostridioformis]NSJ32500.1 hypothetical protein [Enterocloster clostridioformis]
MCGNKTRFNVCNDTVLVLIRRHLLHIETKCPVVLDSKIREH